MWRVVRIRGTERVWIEGGSRNFSQYCGQVETGGEFRVGVFLGSLLFCCFYIYQNNYYYRCKST